MIELPSLFLLRTPLYYRQFTWSQRNKNSHTPWMYLFSMDISLINTINCKLKLNKLKCRPPSLWLFLRTFTLGSFARTFPSSARRTWKQIIPKYMYYKVLLINTMFMQASIVSLDQLYSSCQDNYFNLFISTHKVEDGTCVWLLYSLI